jgi:gamma-glutamyltranspeptidase/glutathione hydrolase
LDRDLGELGSMGTGDQLADKRAGSARRPVVKGRRLRRSRLVAAGVALGTAAWLCALSCVPALGGATHRWRAVAATVHPLATEAAIDAMKKGGNAVDAAVAAALTLGVVDGYNSGLGGGCFMLIRLADGRCVALDGRETAPAAATRDMFVRGGQADPRLSQTGPLAVGIPGSLAVYQYAVAHYGRLRLKDLLLPAARLADRGFAIDEAYAARIREVADDLRQFPASAAILLRADGSPLQAGDVLRQPDLARTYRTIAHRGVQWFYQGPFAHAAEAALRSRGGRVVAEDFARYQLQFRDPVRTTYRGYEIIGFSPPSSGGVHVAQILNILERFDLKAMGAGSADFVHVVAEAMKLAFADRAHWLGDPDFAPVPRGLASKDYAAQLAKLIRLDRTTPVPQHGEPPGAAEDVFGRRSGGGEHTTHFSTADAAGNWVACTATLNTAFGSKFVVPGTGVFLNNQMDDFAIQPGVPNFFGLVGAEANAVAPGKRPLSSMSPTIVLKDGQPVLALGAAGGPTIISQVVLALLYTIDFGWDVQAALAAPRFHHQWRPDELRLETKAGEALMRALEARGHKVVPVEAIGVTQVVAMQPGGLGLVGGADPRAKGCAMGW